MTKEKSRDVGPVDTGAMHDCETGAVNLSLSPLLCSSSYIHADQLVGQIVEGNKLSSLNMDQLLKSEQNRQLKFFFLLPLAHVLKLAVARHYIARGRNSTPHLYLVQASCMHNPNSCTKSSLAQSLLGPGTESVSRERDREIKSVGRH